MTHTHDLHRPAAASRLRAWLLCTAVCVALIAPAAFARQIGAGKPSVEVHLEVLKDLVGGATSFAAPVPGRDSISASYLPPPGQSAPQPATATTSSGRKVPTEQPDMGQYGALSRKPVNGPFGKASAPLPRSVTPKPKAKPAPAAKPKEPVKDVAKEVTVKPAVVETPKIEVPKLDATPPAPAAHDEKKLMEALEKETNAAPAPVVEPVAPAPEIPPAVPDIKLPEAPAIPDLKPDLALPAIPLPDAAPAPAAEVPKLPAPETLVIEKGGAELPPIPALPAPGEAAPKAELMPELSKRMDTLFAKQPEKEGIVSDTTTIEGLSPDAQKNADAAKARLAEDQEKARAEQLRQQEELKKLTDKPLENNMPAPKDVPKMESTEIAALPPITLPGGPIPAANEVDLPPPALPPLTPITGDAEKSSLDIVQPQDGIAAKDNTAPAMQPLDAPETLPKVTKGDGEVPALPPLEVPKAEDTKASNSPPVPDFSAMKMPETEEKPTGTKVAIAEQPKPDFVTAEEFKAATPEATPVPAPAADGNIASSFTFDKDKTDLDEASKAQLNSLAEGIINKNQSVRIVSYAAGTPDQASIARRISLSRALQIRAFLIDKGVNQLKINVQAMGNKEQAERADIYLK